MDYEKMEQDAEIIDEFSARLASYGDTEITDIEEVEVEETEIEETKIEESEVMTPEIEEVNAPVDMRNSAINRYLNSDFGSHEEQQIKKIMAAAVTASRSGYSPEEIASYADESAIRIKTAYKVSTGELDITKSTEVLIDQAAARLDTLIQKNLDMEWVGKRVLDAISVAYPPAARLKPYVAPVMKKIEPKVRKVISTGIKKVSSYAINAVRSISTVVKNLAKFRFA